jgi:uncharacterized protein (DUF433 family)
MPIMATHTSSKPSWIQKRTGICGGRACVRNTRITVWGLINSRRLGLADDQILKNIAGLTPEDLVAAWEYYESHRTEIDEDIRENEADYSPARPGSMRMKTSHYPWWRSWGASAAMSERSRRPGERTRH